MKHIHTFENFLNEAAVKQFDKDYADMVKNIKSGYGWIDPEYVADTWENSSDSIDFELVKVELYKRLLKAGLLWYGDEEKETQVKSLKELGIKESVNTFEMGIDEAKAEKPENLEDKLKALETDDYQNRKGGYPRDGVADTIEYWDHSLSFEFKNTDERRAERWAKNFLSGKNLNPKKIEAEQSGDYHDDWVTVIAYFK
jgi:hypothetical protein